MSNGHAIVLGGHGFLGRHVCRALARQGFRVSAIGHGDWTRDEWSAWGISSWQCANIDSRALHAIPDGAGADLAIHCAGGGSVARSYEAPLDDYQRSVDSTAALLEFVRTSAAGRPRVVMTSSAAVYGDQGEVDLTESATRSPVSPYGFHKMISENLCDSYARFFGVRVSIVRLFSVYGEGLRKQLLWDAANKLARGEHSFFGTGHELRDWVHVDDAAALLCAAGIAPGQDQFEIYNGGNAHRTTGQVLTELSQLLAATQVPAFSGETHIGNPRRLTANSRHAQRQLDWVPAVDMTTGLGRYADWFKTCRAG
ncbi:MAG: SDR family oxidoreductase [Betaproteobacteria bacterium]